MTIVNFTPEDLSSLMTTGTSELSTATGMDPNRDVSPNTDNPNSPADVLSVSPLSGITTNVTAQLVSPPAVTDRTDVAVEPPPPTPLPDPPTVERKDPAPQINLIVESVTQRGDQPIQMNIFANLLDLTPPDSDPYIKLPQEYATQAGDNYYDFERPLDLVRFKLDRYWNILKYEGFFDIVEANPYSTRLESDNLPVKREDVSILNDVRLYEDPIWRQGNVAPPVTRYIDQSTAVANSNPFGDPGLHIKEIIRLKANDSVFVLDPANLPGVTTTYEPPQLDPSLFGDTPRSDEENTGMDSNTGKSDPFDDPAAIGDNPTESNGASASPTMNRTATSRTNKISSRQTPSRGNFGQFTGGGGGSY